MGRVTWIGKRERISKRELVPMIRGMLSGGGKISLTCRLGEAVDEVT